MRASWLVVFLLGCEVAAAPAVESAASDSGAGAEDPPEDSAVRDPVEPAHTSACVDIGLDLRALGSEVTESEISMFVGSQLMHIEDQTAGPPPQAWVQRGVGGMHLAYAPDGTTTAMARCEAGVARYLETAPMLPIIMEPAAQVTTPCEPCTVPDPQPVAESPSPEE